MPNPQDQWLQGLGVPPDKFPDVMVMPEDEIKAKPPSSTTVPTAATAAPPKSAPPAARPSTPPASATPASSTSPPKSAPPTSATPASPPAKSPDSPAGAGSPQLSWRGHYELKGTVAKFGEQSKFKGSVDLKGDITAELAPKGGSTPVKIDVTANKGLKGEFELAKSTADTWCSDLVKKLTGLQITERKETLKVEGSAKKCDISAAMTGKIATSLPWLTGFVELKFTLAGWEWKKVAANPDDVTVGGVEVSGGLKGEGIIPLTQVTNSYDLKVTVKAGVAGSVKPNWSVIAAEGAKKFGQEAAKDVAEQGAKEVVKDAAVDTVATAATEGIAVDMAAVLSAAGAVVLPLAAVGAIGFGLYQESKLMKADSEAIQTGLTTRARAVKAAESFAAVMVGGKNRGDDGSQLAEAEISRIMAQTHATRDQVTDSANKALGGYQKIRDSQLARLRDKLFEDACRIFDESHKKDFGMIERLGETWGFRASYRKMLRLILYSDN